MEIEEYLKRFPLRAPAHDIRGRILRAARRAVLGQRVWRWTWGVAAAVLAAVIPINAHFDRTPVPPQNPRVEREAAQLASELCDDAMLPRLRQAISPKPEPRKLEEFR